MPPFPSAARAALLCLAAALGGCGDGTNPAGASKPADTHGVIATAGDCVSFGVNAVKACAAAIERAVAAHEASSASYNNVQACESAIGENRCERSAAGTYRARLSAFMVTIGAKSARAEPLYPVKDGGIGFQTAGNSKVLASDQSLAFSRLALSVAETQAARGKSGKRKQKIF
ncbi:DUF1190 domain-containing protein [Hyphomicrobium sp.]|uniref:DUF1190 domain-containing protein n=1 Tax=Hyphomicrobium sp. TaxID=82 RepID=UPI0025BBE030|nr:DUF1190 domain-containing protein [Hyphomicrobium sp.]MCC7252457.1 DUF1190 domain-containing protein [Hyphomicrobium sp.]